MKRRTAVFLLFGLTLVGTLGSRPNTTPVLALSGRHVKDIAQHITVQIQSASGAGSGVIIHRRQSQYFVLTAKHVLADTQLGEEAYIRTQDDQTHLINTDSILSLSGLDTALVSFESERDYSIATVGASEDLTETDTIYVAGFPLPGNAITQPTFTITKGVLSGLGTFERGYGLVYDSVTQAGMSGGPVLNEKGQLVGIHGLAEGERLQGIPVKAGFNLGIPMHSILSRIPLPIQVARSPVPISDSSATPQSSERAFRQQLERFYAALPRLIEQRDAQSLYDYMPIEREQFRYTTRTGEIQTFTARLVGAAQFYQKSLARKEKWSITFDPIEVEMMTPTQARVIHVETVKWSVWPGLIRGVAKRKEIYEWQQFDGDWLIVSGIEQVP